MFDIPESDIVGVRVDEEAIKTNKSPEYIRSRQVSSTDDQLENSGKVQNNNDNKISLPTGWRRRTESIMIILLFILFQFYLYFLLSTKLVCTY